MSWSSFGWWILTTVSDITYLVREIHASWSASAQQIEWKGFEDWTYESRKRRNSLLNPAGRGFERWISLRDYAELTLPPGLHESQLNSAWMAR